MPFQDISYLELWQPFCLGEQNHLGNFGRGNYEAHFYEIILNLDQWFKVPGDVVLRYFLARALVAILFGGAELFEQLYQRAL